MSNHQHIGIGLAKKGGGLAAIQLDTVRPAPNEVLVKVVYVGVSPLSQWQVDFGLLVNDYPFILGGSVVGFVVRLGADIDYLSLGDWVMGYAWELREHKAMQEYVALPQHLLCKIPPNLSPPEAAGVPDSFVTAWHSLMTELKVPVMEMMKTRDETTAPPTSFLVWGGATSSGMYTIQLLRFCGYRNILTTASPKHADLLKSYGALHVFDYHDEDVTEQIKDTVYDGKVDVVLDCVGDEEKTVTPISKVVGMGSRVGILLPIRVGGYGSTTEVRMETKVPFPTGVKAVGVRTHYYTTDPILKAMLQPALMRTIFASGEIKPNPIRLIEGNTFMERVENTLDVMRRGGVSGEKLVVLVPDDYEDPEGEE